MPLKDFRVVEAVGKGSFASVYKVMRKSDNKIYAMKRVKIGKMGKKEISDALNEIRFLASIRQKNIVGFLEAFLENNETELCIIMEYCGCGDLAQKVERYKRRRQLIEEDVIWRYIIQAIKALCLLHDSGICHRDLKAANTFIADDGSIKIGDMNVSKRMQSGLLKTQIGTPYYMSPEIWNNRPYDYSCDMWALGCMIYELCALRPPFLGDSFPALKRSVTAGNYSPIPSKYSNSLKRVIDQLLKVQPGQRLSAMAALNCPEVQAKLHLDHCDDQVALERQMNGMNLMATIKVPQNMKKLGCALPKACYPDIRPNTPSAWTVAEQLDQQAPPPITQVAPSVVHAERPTKFKSALSDVNENQPPVQEDEESSSVSKAPSDRVKRVIQYHASKQQLRGGLPVTAGVPPPNQAVPLKSDPSRANINMAPNPTADHSSHPQKHHHQQPPPMPCEQPRGRYAAPAPSVPPPVQAAGGVRYVRPNRLW